MPAPGLRRASTNHPSRRKLGRQDRRQDETGVGRASVRAVRLPIPGVVDSHRADTFPIGRHHSRAARLSSMILSVLLCTTDKSLFTIHLRNLAADCGSNPSPHKGSHARRLPSCGADRVLFGHAVTEEVSLSETAAAWVPAELPLSRFTLPVRPVGRRRRCRSSGAVARRWVHSPVSPQKMIVNQSSCGTTVLGRLLRRAQQSVRNGHPIFHVQCRVQPCGSKAIAGQARSR